MKAVRKLFLLLTIPLCLTLPVLVVPAQASPVFEFNTFELWDNNVYRASNPTFIMTDTVTTAAFTATDYEKIGEGYLVLQGRYDGLFYATRNDLNLSMATLGLGWWGEFPAFTQYQIMAKYRSRSYQSYAGSTSYGGSIDLFQRWNEFSFQERYEVEHVSTSNAAMNYTTNGFGIYGFWKIIAPLTLGTGYSVGFGNINYILLQSPFSSDTRDWSVFANYNLGPSWLFTVGYDSQQATINPTGTPATASRQIYYAGIYFKIQ